MNEVQAFCQEHPDMGKDFCDFATQYETLAEVWEHCQDVSDMLWILYKRQYTNADKLKDFILSVYNTDSDRIVHKETENRAEKAQVYILSFKEEMEKQVADGLIREDESKLRVGAVALHESVDAYRIILKEALERAIWNNAVDKIILKDVGIVIRSEEPDLNQIRSNKMKLLANKLREVIGNPFHFAHWDDFYHGRSF
jgi:hypothetical protein